MGVKFTVYEKVLFSFSYDPAAVWFFLVLWAVACQLATLWFLKKYEEKAKMKLEMVNTKLLSRIVLATGLFAMIFLTNKSTGIPLGPGEFSIELHKDVNKTAIGWIILYVTFPIVTIAITNFRLMTKELINRLKPVS